MYIALNKIIFNDNKVYYSDIDQVLLKLALVKPLKQVKEATSELNLLHGPEDKISIIKDGSIPAVERLRFGEY